MNTYCTIINKKYFPFAAVLYQSLLRTDPSVNMHVLVSDAEDRRSITAAVTKLHIHAVTDILTDSVAKGIYNKYSATNHDELRWALKPVFVLHLLREYEKVIFIDPDMYFTDAHGFLFAELDKYSILLSPHWGNTNPLEDEDGLYSMLRNGLFSGGFIGATRKAQKALRWWAEACHYRVDKVKELGLYDDQKYLDILPLLNESTGLIRHKGCNLTNLNIATSRRELVNGKLVINSSFDPIFIHFTRDTVRNIQNGNDSLLIPYLEEYIKALYSEGMNDKVFEGVPQSIFYTVKKKLLLRTRLKRFLYKLSQKK